MTVRLFQGRELGEAEFAALIEKNPSLAYREMVRDAFVYGWHRVHLNGEFSTGRVAFYD